MRNLLNLALRVCPKQTVQWYQFQSKTTNEIGLDVSVLAAPVPIVGSFQPLDRSKIQNMGLDYNKSYVKLYTSTNLADLVRDGSGDQFEFAGDRYEVMSNTQWFNVDGWNGSLAVKLTP